MQTGSTVFTFFSQNPWSLKIRSPEIRFSDVRNSEIQMPIRLIGISLKRVVTIYYLAEKEIRRNPNENKGRNRSKKYPRTPRPADQPAALGYGIHTTYQEFSPLRTGACCLSPDGFAGEVEGRGEGGPNSFSVRWSDSGAIHRWTRKHSILVTKCAC